MNNNFPVTPVILINDNILKVDNAIKLTTIPSFIVGSNEEYPSLVYSDEICRKLIVNHCNFIVECTFNPDERQLKQVERYSKNSLNWYVPIYAKHVEEIFQVRISSTINRSRFSRLTLAEFSKLPEGDYVSQFFGNITTQQAYNLGFKLVAGENFSYWRVKEMPAHTVAVSVPQSITESNSTQSILNPVLASKPVLPISPNSEALVKNQVPKLKVSQVDKVHESTKTNDRVNEIVKKVLTVEETPVNIEREAKSLKVSNLAEVLPVKKLMPLKKISKIARPK